MEINDFIDFSKIELKREWVNEFLKFINGFNFIPLNEKRIDMMYETKSKDRFSNISKKLKKTLLKVKITKNVSITLKKIVIVFKNDYPPHLL